MKKRTRRPPNEIWQATRKRIWERDRGRCQGFYCKHLPIHSISLNHAHIDHILELSRGGTNRDENLRVLCRRCHCLRANITHQGMIADALRDGIVPPNWREFVWEG